MIRFYLIFLSAILIISCRKLELADEVSFMNPILDSGPDPWVIQKDSFYYYTNTLNDKIQLWRTKSMSRLYNGNKKIIWQSSFSGPHCYNVWAPELHYLDGKWYIYYAAAATPNVPDQRIYILENSSADPLEGVWQDKGVLSNLSDIFSIDPTILELNNKKYFIWSSIPSSQSINQGIYIAEMSDPLTLSTARILISSPTNLWEKQGVFFDEGVDEGPEILKNKNGNIFLTFSASSCFGDSYCLGMLSLKNGGNPLNPTDWIKNDNPVFNTYSKSLTYGPGHNAFFKSPDGTEDWIIYHAHSEPGQSCDGNRNPRIQKFTWNSDGSPNFGIPLRAFKKFPRPSGEKD